ncbi:hypothetical protein WK59_12090 [Burkholderia ubonensis]|uniref:hypothetical protein n=1 Tax=Burkholderia ubonensis TaxID=101571 RepID=UPI000759B04F|nr:hypothetical protein [Burkholderia ubonensis]KVT85703.1 hypothetical protein WK59_12090 [Burkholderia ubonensis]
MEEFAKTYVPLASALISLVSVLIALVSLRYARKDRHEQQRAAEADAQRRDKERAEQQRAAAADSLRREQQALFDALQGEKESVGFMAIQLSRDPQLVTNENRHRLFSALCLAFVFESSSRAKALVLKALRNFSKDDAMHSVIVSILKEIEDDFFDYEKEIGPGELKEYYPRIENLRKNLRPKTSDIR